MDVSESQLSPNGLEVLKTIRALRELPETESGYRAERSLLRKVGVTDLKIIALILAEEAAEERRRA